MSEEVKSEFKIITGTNNVILVAPHGNMKKPRDDEQTAELTRQIQKILNCYAVINEVYRKNREGEPTFDEALKICNLNHIDYYEDTPLYGAFVGPIKQFKEEIIKRGETPYIFHIHGASRKKFDNARKEVSPKNWKNVSILIGTGRGILPKSGDESLTAYSTTVNKLIDCFKEEKVLAYSTNSEGYTAKKDFNLNQLFKIRYPDDNVLSFQLEIRKKDFRDIQKNIEATADKLALAISKLTGVEIQLPENMEQPAEAQLLLTHIKEKPDEDLIEEAYSKLAGIFFSHYQNALLEAGQYIIEKFYNDDIELARQKKPIKKESYTQLVERLQQQREDSPKKSWLFNAVNLVIQEYDFKSVQALGQLNTTQKLLLLTVHKPVKKQRFAEEAVEKGYTTRQLAEAIKNAKKQRKKTINSYLTKPEELFSSEHSHLYSRDALAEIKPKQRESIKKKIKKQAGEIRAGISEQHLYAEQYEALIEAVDTVGNNDGSEPDKDNGKIFGTWEWAVKNVSITTGCSNDCRYCYARHEAERFGRMKKGEWPNMVVRDQNVFKRFRKYNGNVLFPSSHDILPENLHACTIVLENLLKVGNRMLIVSKPRMECIEQLCKYFRNYKDQILFRFTIGATDNEILKFWEPGAPEYEERKSCLELAHQKKFKTSVSAEPMLDSANIDKLIDELLPFITDALWVGKMNKIKTRINIDDEQTTVEVKKIEYGQTDEIIKGIYQRHKDNPQIKWKDSIKKVVGLERAKKPGLDK